MRRVWLLLCLLLLSWPNNVGAAQQPAPSLQRLAGLRSEDHRGSFKAATFLPDGNAVLLFDQGDGLRLLKTDASTTSVLAEVHLGAAGDAGVSLCADGKGTVYIAGFASSGSLNGTSGAVFPAATDTSLNSFLAGFDSNLKLSFLTFLGADRTAVSSIAVSNDALFATGTTYSARFPVSAGAMQGIPVSGNSGTAFVERFSLDASTLQWATYLGGIEATTTPTAIATDASDAVYVAGSTSSPLFPTKGALQSSMPGSVSGFLAKLDASGDRLVFATYLAGGGITSMARDASTNTLLLTGILDPGRFPLARAPGPLASVPYQSLLRLSADSQSLLSSALLFPGVQSWVTAGPAGDAWATGNLTAPLTQEEQNAGTADSYVVHLTAAGDVDRALRVGGTATNNVPYASMSATPGPLALPVDGLSALVPGTISLATDPSLVASQTFALALSAGETAVVPDASRDLLPAACAADTSCGGWGGFLGLLGPAAQAGVVTVDTSHLPQAAIRNAGLEPLSSLVVSAANHSVHSNCPQTLAPGAQCGVLLGGSGGGALVISAANLPPQTFAFSSLPTAAQTPLFVSTAELDFGLVSSTSPVSRTFTVTNLGEVAQTFASAPDGLASEAAFALAETGSTCAGPPQAHVLAAGSACEITVALSASPLPGNDGVVHAAWRIGASDLLVTGFTEAAPLSVSAQEVDFGAQTLVPASRLPRYLYLTNASQNAFLHTPATLPPEAPFQVVDHCPNVLAPLSVCQITLLYVQQAASAYDSATLLLDQGLAVEITGQTGPPDAAPDAELASPLLVSPHVALFQNAVPLSGVSTETQTIQVTNTSSSSAPVMASAFGDFAVQSTCGAMLAPGSSCNLVVQFRPSQTGARQGLLSVSSGPSSQPGSVLLRGTATPLFSPDISTIDFGETTAGEPNVRWFQVQGVFQTLKVDVASPSFGVALLPDNGNRHGTLAPSAFGSSATSLCVNCWIGVQFFPQAAGSFAGELWISSDPAGSVGRMALAGTGLAAQRLLLSPVQTDFGGVPVHSTSAPRPFTLTNLVAGGSDAQVLDVAVSGDFVLAPSPYPCSGTVANAAACEITIVFAPTAEGERNGVLRITTNLGSVTASLRGTGTKDSGLALSPSALHFDSVGQQAVTLTNTSPRPITLQDPVSDSNAFLGSSGCAVLAPQQNCQVMVTYAPQGGVSQGFLSFSALSSDLSGLSYQTTYALAVSAGSGPSGSGLSVFPASGDFGVAAVGDSPRALRQFTLTNTSTGSVSVDLSASRNFPLAGLPDCEGLAPGEACSFSVLFDPVTAGSLTGSVVARAVAQDGSLVAEAVVSLQGFASSNGLLTLSSGTPSNAAIDFGSVHSGQRAERTVDITNGGSSPVTIRRLTTTTPFLVSGSCEVILPGSTCSAYLTYSPVLGVPANASSLPVADTGSLAIESDAESSPDTVFLRGQVTPAVSDSLQGVSLPTYRLSRGALTFADASPGTSTPATDLLLLNTGSVPLNVTQVRSSPEFPSSTDCSAVLPSHSCTIHVSFAPTPGSPEGVRAATLSISSDAATALDFVSLLGSAVVSPLQLGTTSLDFGSLAVGSKASLGMPLRNATTLPVALGRWSTTGDFQADRGTCPPPGSSLGAGQTCTLSVVFAPTGAGPRTGHLTLPSAGTPGPLLVSLAGVGLAGKLQVNLSAIQFGTLEQETASAQPLQLTNVGTAVLTGISLSVAGPDASAFTASAACPANGLAVGNTCTAQVVFRPNHLGAHAATLLTMSSDPAGPEQVALAGTGAAAPGFILSVNGASTAAVSVAGGSAAAFPLLLTPQGNFAGPVSLTCTANAPAPNALCSLSGSTMSLISGPAHGTASISTASGILPATLAPLTLLPYLLRLRRRKMVSMIHPRKATKRATLVWLGALPFLGLLVGCVGGDHPVGAPYTPAGTYTYQVTARSMQGAALSSSVTLTVIVH